MTNVVIEIEIAGVWMTENEPEQPRALMASQFIANHHKFRAHTREQSRKAAGDLLDAHCYAFSANVSYQSRIQGIQYEATDPAITGRMTLIAQFMQGTDTLEVAISEGLYAQAGALLKQALETIIAMDEFRDGNRVDGRTPQFGRTNFGRVYGQLNNVAHPSTAEVAEELASYTLNDKTGPTTIPLFNEQVFTTFYGWHAMLLVMMFQRLRDVFVPIFKIDCDDQELAMVIHAHKILVARGVIEA